jgi:hypothetical protein
VANAGTESEIDASFAHLVQQKSGISVEADPYLLTDESNWLRWREAFPARDLSPPRKCRGRRLASYGTDLADAYRQIGVYTAVSSTEQPASLP